MAEEPTRKDLQAQLEVERTEKAKLEDRLARLEAAFAANQETAEQRAVRERHLATALEELALLRPNASQMAQTSGRMPKLQPYKGLVRATGDCTYGGQVRGGPGTQHAQAMRSATYDPDGEVFPVDVSSLWSDDPFVPVQAVTLESGATRYDPRKDVQIVDARWRPSTPVQLVG